MFSGLCQIDSRMTKPFGVLVNRANSVLLRTTSRLGSYGTHTTVVRVWDVLAIKIHPEMLVAENL